MQEKKSPLFAISYPLMLLGIILLILALSGLLSLVEAFLRVQGVPLTLAGSLIMCSLLYLHEKRTQKAGGPSPIPLSFVGLSTIGILLSFRLNWQDPTVQTISVFGGGLLVSGLMLQFLPRTTLRLVLRLPWALALGLSIWSWYLLWWLPFLGLLPGIAAFLISHRGLTWRLAFLKNPHWPQTVGIVLALSMATFVLSGFLPWYHVHVELYPPAYDYTVYDASAIPFLPEDCAVPNVGCFHTAGLLAVLVLVAIGALMLIRNPPSSSILRWSSVLCYAIVFFIPTTGGTFSPRFVSRSMDLLVGTYVATFAAVIILGLAIYGDAVSRPRPAAPVDSD